MKLMEFCMNWVRIEQNGFISIQDEAICFRIISKPFLIPSPYLPGDKGCRKRKLFGIVTMLDAMRESTESLVGHPTGSKEAH